VARLEEKGPNKTGWDQRSKTCVVGEERGERRKEERTAGWLPVTHQFKKRKGLRESGKQHTKKTAAPAVEKKEKGLLNDIGSSF